MEKVININEIIIDDYDCNSYRGTIPFFSANSELTMEEVEKNPEKYIIEECIPACQELWQKNIFTTRAGKYSNGNGLWIEIKESALSFENLAIYDLIYGSDVVKFKSDDNTLIIGITGNNSARLLEVVKSFNMQDIQLNNGYITLEDFFIAKGFVKEIPNQGYIRDQQSNEPEYSKKNINIFDASLVTKPYLNYFINEDCILEGNIVYLNGYYYSKHLKYMQNYILQEAITKMK